VPTSSNPQHPSTPNPQPPSFPFSALIAIAGSRYGSPYPVSPVVAFIKSSGGSIITGCAKGVDLAVRQADPTAQVLKASSFGYGKYSFAKRTKAVVSASTALILFPPSSAVLGRGSTLALNTALSLNLPIWQAGPNPPAKNWQAYSIANQQGYLLLPNQTAIFPV